MTPFEEFRIWLRGGARSERISAAIAAIVALALVIWIAVPTGKAGSSSQLAVGTSGSGTNSGSSAGGSVGGSAAGGSLTPGTSGASGSNGSTPGSGGGSVSSGSSGSGVALGSGSGGPGVGGGSTAGGSSGNTSTGGSTAGGSPGAGNTTATTIGGSKSTTSTTVGSTTQSCSGLTATDQGVTATTISIAVTVISVAGANSLLGVPSPSVQQAADQAEVNYINNHGGLDCRKLVPHYYTDNPIDANSEHSVCLDIAAAKVFAVIGGLYTAANFTCLEQQKLPSFTQEGAPTSLIKQFYPYLFTPEADSATTLKTLVYGAKAQGFFTGLTKLGIVYEDCYPEYLSQIEGPLNAIGIPSSDFVTYDYGCPAGGLTSPTVVQAAELKLSGAQANRIISAGANLATFSGDAQTGGYHPEYAVSDLDETVALTPSTGYAPNSTNFNNTLAIIQQQYGALNTPGVALSSYTATCDKILQSGGAEPATYGDAYTGQVCNQFLMFQLAAENAPELTRTALVVGLDKVGQLGLSYPTGPGLFNMSGVTYAGEYWRVDRFNSGCSCWKVAVPSYSLDY